MLRGGRQGSGRPCGKAWVEPPKLHPEDKQPEPCLCYAANGGPREGSTVCSPYTLAAYLTYTITCSHVYTHVRTQLHARTLSQMYMLTCNKHTLTHTNTHVFTCALSHTHPPLLADLHLPLWSSRVGRTQSRAQTSTDRPDFSACDVAIRTSLETPPLNLLLLGTSMGHFQLWVASPLAPRGLSCYLNRKWSGNEDSINQRKI